MKIAMTDRNKYVLFLTAILILFAVLMIYPVGISVADKPTGTTGTEITGCASQAPTNYTNFVATDFSLINVGVDSSKYLVLNTGSQAIDPNSIVVPFDQEVSVTFIFEGAGYTKTDFGWFFAKDVSTANGTLNADGTANFPALLAKGLTHEIYFDVNDNNNSYNSGNGVLDKSSSDTSDRYGDTNGDGAVNVLDNKIVLGNFASGTELAFYLKVDDQTCNGASCVYYTKTAWNPDFYDTCRDGTGNGTKAYTREFKLGVAGGESFNLSSGWLSQTAIDRIKTYFGITLTGSKTVTYQRGVKHPHVIVGAPPTDPNQWVLGWDDQKGCTPAFRVGDKLCGSNGKTTCTDSDCGSQECRSDMDSNDLVFRINRKTGGTAALQPAQAIKPTDTAAYFTGVTMEVYDDMPCNGQTSITYSVSPDNGTTWIKIDKWDEVYVNPSAPTGKTIGSAVASWSPGKPEYTMRRVRVDFASSGKVGQAFLWKAEMVSESDACVPKIMGVNFDFTVAKHGVFARSAPVAQVNMMYAGSYETPLYADDLTDMNLRGHLIATRLYDPTNPNATYTKTIWDAGTRLNLKTPANRNIYFPDIQILEVTETIGKGDSTDSITGTKTFKFTATHQPMQDGSLVIIDGTPTNFTEKFTETNGDTLVGTAGGTGSIDRFTGTFTVTFKKPPSQNYPINATYSYYKTSPTLKAFKPTTPANVTPLMLGLVSDWSYDKNGNIVFADDFNKDGKMDQKDADWLVNWTRGAKDGVSAQKTWMLGPIDHSTPAVDVPPGTKPSWYFGTAFSKEEKAVYDTFATTYKDKPTVIYAGSRDGMLHAFDGGKFQWGDNPQTTDIEEYVGYFKWAGNSYTDDIYGKGDELWAFIPVNLLGRLKNNYKGKTDQAYVDASPTVVDVFINNKWTSVLLSAEGDGGNTVFCLDVTEPSYDKVKFLWEYSNPDLKLSKSSPSVAIIQKIKTGGESKWVAFFVSGQSNAAQYPSIYVVDIADGRLLKRVFLNATEVGTAALGGLPSGQPAVLDFDGDGYIDRLYIGTDKGYLYKVNITGDDNWTVCALNTTVSNPLPIFGTPVVLVDRGYDDSGNVYEGVRIFYGTGDSPYKSDDISASTIFSFYGFYDGNTNSECTPIKDGPSFKYDLPAGEKVWTSAFAAAGRIYFGTTTADTEDPCDGYGVTSKSSPHLYVFDSKASGDAVDPLNTIATPNMNIPPLVDDGHLYIRSPDGKITSYGSDKYNNRPAPVFQAQPPKQKTWREVY